MTSDEVTSPPTTDPAADPPEVKPLPDDFVDVMEYLNHKYRLYMREPRVRPIYDAIRPENMPTNRRGSVITNRPELREGFPRDQIPSAAPKPMPEAPPPEPPEPTMAEIEEGIEQLVSEGPGGVDPALKAAMRVDGVVESETIGEEEDGEEQEPEPQDEDEAV